MVIVAMKKNITGILILRTLLLSLTFCSSVEMSGWVTEGNLIAQPGPCNIDVKEADLTQEEFLHKYAYTAPVVINMPKNWNQEFRGACEKERMVSQYGDKIIRLSSANTHSYEKRDVTLEYYILNILKPQSLDTLGSDTFYWFGDNNHTEWQELFDLYRTPKVNVPNKEPMYSFGLAGAGTGVPFHWHGPGFGEVVFGRKRWFLYPPDQTPHFHPNETTLHWLINDYPEIPPAQLPIECTLYEGDVIYFPDRWWHATLNLDTSVFISTFLG